MNLKLDLTVQPRLGFLNYMARTILYIFSSFFLALFFLFDFFNKLPLVSLLKNGLITLSTVIHEVGHSIFYIFYGYVAIPSFDLQYGGGLTTAFSNQNYLLSLMVFIIFLALSLLVKRYNKILTISLTVLLILLFSLTFFSYHQVVISFMGHGFEIIIGCFFLYRCVFNFSFNGTYERFLNGFFGLFLNMQIIKYFYNVIYDSYSRLEYINQKGGVNFGDFSVIANNLGVSLNSVCFFAIICAFLAILIPILHYLFTQIFEAEFTKID